jgi:hypothetical protein
MWSHWHRDPDTREKIPDDPWNVILAARGETAEKTNEELAAANVGGEVVAEISRSDWYRRVVWRPYLMVEVLESAEVGDQALRDLACR